MLTCKSTKCLIALWTNSVIEKMQILLNKKKKQQNIIKISNDIALNVEEFHLLLLEKKLFNFFL